ncbi:MAG: PhoH family protein [Candidatus Eisenbacteria bacterium]|uniref:PhoH-like protein n=1 Tax=Eiseniibacteriota bacterium TaxID=2212470 RepID=A0A7Y2E844_UNCEI|nr:PhoH family protein [Candidatus Eisenbacteria bacterium]
MSFELNDIKPLDLVGERDANLRHLEQQFQVSAVLRNGSLTLSGEEDAVAQANSVVQQLLERVHGGRAVTIPDIDYLSSLLTEEGPEALEGTNGFEELQFERRTVKLKSVGQSEYVSAIRDHDVVFGIGPAGTGKTYLAVAMGVQALRARAVERIILVRPAVEAGESLGFLPGTFEDKIDPYLRPLYDALRDLLPHEKVRKYMDLGVLEIAPLAYMRGRTLSRAFVVLDEAQNTTLKQMKMFLTRLGPYSKAVITGDITQVDLPNAQESGLIRIEHILKGTEGISFTHFQNRDVVRHRLVRSILSAFEKHEGSAD